MFTRRLTTICLTVALAWTMAPMCASAQGMEQVGQPQDMDAAVEFWNSTPRLRAAAAVQLAAIRQPYLIAVMRQKAHDLVLWGDAEFAGNLAPALNRDFLEDIVDSKPIPDIRGKEEKQIRKHELAMYRAFNQAVIYSFENPVEAFKKSAKEFEFVKFSHLWNQTKDHRGDVIPLKGWLARLRQQPATIEVRQKTGLNFVYEGWVFGETKHAHPYAVIFPVLPAGLEVSEKMNRPVTFAGYFLGKIRVVVEKGEIDVPLLVGPTIFPEPAPVAAPPEPVPFLAMALIVGGVIAAVAAIVFVIAIVFRRGDSKIQERLIARRNQEIASILTDATEIQVGEVPDPLNQTGVAPGPPDSIRRL